MTILQVMTHDAPQTPQLRTRDETQIGEILGGLGIEYARWNLRLAVTPQTTPDELLKAYRGEIDTLCARDDLVLVDVAQLHPSSDPESELRAAKARLTFLEEHRHAEDEVRFFAQGTGCFYLHIDQRVYAVVCEAGDLLSVPAGTLHWFDMGPSPDFAAIRFFKEEDGWVGDFTGDPVADRFPRLDALLEANDET